MSVSVLKPSVIARAAVGLLQRELVILSTVWTDAIASREFAGALNDTVTLRVPAVRTASVTTVRNGTIESEASTEFGVPVQLNAHVYNAAEISDAELTLDIQDFGLQVLQPQVRAVAEGLEERVANIITSADYATDLEINASNPYKTAIQAAKALNSNNVPRSGRTLLVGSSVEAAILESDRIAKVSESGSDSALREATIGRFAGFTVVGSNAIPEDEAYAYVRSAYAVGVMAPANPEGATFSESVSYNGLGLRWLRDYNYASTTDRSLVSAYFGGTVVEDAITPTNPQSDTVLKRAVKLHLPGSSS